MQTIQVKAGQNHRMGDGNRTLPPRASLLCAPVPSVVSPSTSPRSVSGQNMMANKPVRRASSDYKVSTIRWLDSDRFFNQSYFATGSWDYPIVSYLNKPLCKVSHFDTQGKSTVWCISEAGSEVSISKVQEFEEAGDVSGLELFEEGGREVLVSSAGGQVTVRAVAVAEGRAAVRRTAGGGPLLAVLRDGPFQVVSGGDGLALLDANLATVATDRGDGSRLTSIAAKAGAVLSTSLAGTVRLWDSRQPPSELLLRPSLGTLRSVAVRPHGGLLELGLAGSGGLGVWDLRHLRQPLLLAREPTPALCVSCDGPPGVLLTGGADGSVRRWSSSRADRARLDSQALLAGQHALAVNALALSPTGARLLAATDSERVFLLSL